MNKKSSLSPLILSPLIQMKKVQSLTLTPFLILFFSVFVYASIPTCSNPQNGLKLSTYDITGYLNEHPSNHDEYNTLETNYAVAGKLFGSGVVDDINTTGYDNNPYHSGTDEQYLSIFDGYIHVPQDGNYSLAVNGDDAVEVIIDNNSSYGWYNGHSSDSTNHNHVFLLTKGYHQLKFRHQEWVGDDSYQLYWKKQGNSSYSIVPKNNLFYCAPPKPVADYHMDKCNWNGTLGDVKDSSGNDLNGTSKNGAITESSVGGGIYKVGKFDNKSYITIPDNQLLQVTNNYVFLAWIKTIKSSGTILSKTDLNNPWYGYVFAIGPDSGGKLALWNGSGGWTTSSGSAVNDGSWHQVGVVVEGRTLKFYVDGAQDGVTKTLTSITNTSTEDLRIGFEQNPGADSRYFSGNIDEVKVFDKALTNNDIRNIYNYENSGKNYDGTQRSYQSCTPTCNLQNGLTLSTYDITGYSHQYPNDHNEYNTLETDYAVADKRFGSGIVDKIDTIGSDNNPYHSGTDEKYLSIFNGYINTPSDGNYSFAINGDDAVEVTIDNVHYGWYGGHGSDTTTHNRTYILSAGYHTIKFRHQEWGGGDSYQLYWKKQGDSNSYRIVPKHNLFYCAPPKPVVDYRMDKCSWDGTLGDVKDSSGNDLNGTAKNGANTDMGKLCKAGKFNNTKYIEVPNNSLLNPTGAFTSSVWVKAYTISTWNGVVSKLTNVNSNTGRGWNIQVGTAQKIASLMADSNGSYVYLNSTTTPQVGIWYHIALVHYADNRNDLYVNGIKEASNTHAIAFTNNPLQIGKFYTDSNSLYFDGQIDELKIFNKSLTANQIKSIYDNEKSGRNYDGNKRLCTGCGVVPTCSLSNGLKLSTFDISGYSHQYPINHDEYNTLENSYAIGSKEFGSGIVDNINTTGSNNNPYHSGTDEKYLSIFDGYINVPQDGSYSFAINGDDAVEVIIDNNYFGWYNGHGSDSTTHNQAFNLSAGYHTIKFRHQEWSGGDSYQLYWKKPGYNSYSIVPKNNLFYCSTAYFFDAWDTDRNKTYRHISTKIVNSPIHLTIAALDKDGTNYQDFNGTVCASVDNNTSKLDFRDINTTTALFKVSRALKNVRVQIAWKKDVNESCPLNNEDNETNSSDNFAIRPDKFIIDINSSSPKAGVNFHIDVNATQFGGGNARDYNETNGNSFSFDMNDSNSSCSSGTLNGMPNPFKFYDGNISFDANYSDVGDINFTVHEINGSEFAYIDVNDTNDSQRLITPDSKKITVYPYKFAIVGYKFSRNPDKNWRYMSDVNESNITLSFKIQAQNKQGSVTHKFDKKCYASAVGIKANFTSTSSDGNVSYYQKINNQSVSDHNKSLSDFNLSETINDQNFTDGNSSQVIYALNIYRKRNNPKNPLDINVTEINTTDSNTTNLGLVPDNNGSSFYYGRAKTKDITTNKQVVNNTLHVEVYSNSKNSFVNHFHQESLNWYVMKNDNQQVITDLNGSSKFDSISNTNLNISNLVYNNGILKFDLTNAGYPNTLKAYVHVKVPSYLWYSRYKDYNATGDCSKHPCFLYTFQHSGSKNYINSGDFNGTSIGIEYNATKTKKGVKVFR